jgi:hypothetical protein
MAGFNFINFTWRSARGAKPMAGVNFINFTSASAL